MINMWRESTIVALFVAVVAVSSAPRITLYARTPGISERRNGPCKQVEPNFGLRTRSISEAYKSGGGVSVGLSTVTNTDQQQKFASDTSNGLNLTNRTSAVTGVMNDFPKNIQTWLSTSLIRDSNRTYENGMIRTAISGNVESGSPDFNWRTDESYPLNNSNDTSVGNSPLTVEIRMLIPINVFLGQHSVLSDEGRCQAVKKITTTTTSTASPPTKTTNETTKCPTNMTLYRGLNSEEIDCDCLRNYAYHEGTGSCFKLFTIGPCNENQYFILKRGEMDAECVDNPCPRDQVFYNRSCTEINVIDATSCGDDMSLVVSDDLEVTCTKTSVLFKERPAPTTGMIDPLPYPCPPGFRRTKKNVCREKRTS